MYTNFFGFKERPFQLVPNPAYLFLSHSHEEAMAHLNYAISHGDGFVEITGEAGTGKTTLCRAFLDELNPNTEVAYIFNPRLNSLELLRAINSEFGIDADADNIKDLIDSLNAFLLDKKAQGKNALLLIDEAQNLSPDVLEQLRLLSNLETNTCKLLQIILVGQPELQKILDSYDLRQLKQRITLRWFLTPLDGKETRDYIRHRINIASKKSEDKFSGPAYSRIYKYSGGIPRLINIACDRALLTAFGFNRDKVTGWIASRAIKELKGRVGDSRRLFTPGRVLAGLTALLCLAVIGLFLFKKPPLPAPNPAGIPDTGAAQIPVNTISQGMPAVTPTPAAKVPLKFTDVLGNLTGRSSRAIALKSALSLWTADNSLTLDRDLEDIGDDQAFFRIAAARANFQVLPVSRDWDLIEKLNLPAILGFMPPGAMSPRFLVLIKITEKEILFRGGVTGETIAVEPSEVHAYWSGSAFILWKNFYNFSGDISPNAPKEWIFSLKMLLRDIGFKQIVPDYSYDDTTRDIIRQIQAKHGLVTDGIVGTRTKIAIYNEKKDLKIPFIRPFTGSPGEKPGN